MMSSKHYTARFEEKGRIVYRDRSKDPARFGPIRVNANASALSCNHGISHDLQPLTMLAEGFDGYQSKPISVKNFLEEVRRVLS
jgi:hypothetical protein